MSTGVGDLDLRDTELFTERVPARDLHTAPPRGPGVLVPLPRGFCGEEDVGFWVLAKHQDVQAANRDTATFAALDGPALVLRPEMRGAMLVSMDGREHLRQRKRISAGFTPRMIGHLEEQMRRWSATILDAVLERGTCDFVPV